MEHLLAPGIFSPSYLLLCASTSVTVLTEAKNDRMTLRDNSSALDSLTKTRWQLHILCLFTQIRSGYLNEINKSLLKLKRQIQFVIFGCNHKRYSRSRHRDSIEDLHAHSFSFRRKIRRPRTTITPRLRWIFCNVTL